MSTKYFGFVFLSLSFTLITISCKQAVSYNDIVPEHQSFTMQSQRLNEQRTINVWTPPGYDNSSDSLPVMYMADGGIVDEDFPHIANTFDTLIKQGKIPPMILVGIANTMRRRDLTGPTEVDKDREIAPEVGGSSAFRAFISDELFPEIEKRYRINDKKGILGESLSGLFVMETFFLTPELFDYYIAFDPSLWWNDHYLVRHADKFLSEFPDKDIILWFAGSDAEDIQKHTRTLNDILSNNPTNRLTWTYSDEPNEKHHTIFRATKEKALVRVMAE